MVRRCCAGALQDTNQDMNSAVDSAGLVNRSTGRHLENKRKGGGGSKQRGGV